MKSFSAKNIIIRVIILREREGGRGYSFHSIFLLFSFLFSWCIDSFISLIPLQDVLSFLFYLYDLQGHDLCWSKKEKKKERLHLGVSQCNLASDLHAMENCKTLMNSGGKEFKRPYYTLYTDKLYGHIRHKW